MSYYGTVLLTRADVVMTRLPHIQSIGYRHRRLRELGGGWQVLETASWDDTVELEEAVCAAAGWWNAPVFGADVADVCARIHGAVPGMSPWSGHLADPGDEDCGMHRPAAGSTFDELEAQIVDWAAASGLALSAARLNRALRFRHTWQDESDGPYLLQSEQIFEVVRAFGFPVIPAPRAYEFDPDDDPFAQVTGGMWGLAAQARSAAVHRAEGERDDPPAVWEAEAIALELDISAALYGGGLPAAELTARAEWIRAAYRAARENTAPPPKEVMVVTDIARVLHDLGPEMITGEVAHLREQGRPRPNGTGNVDRNGGPGLWPELG